MKQRNFLAIWCVISLILILSALPLTGACAPQEAIVLKATSVLPENNIVGMVMKEYIAKVNERAEGKLTIEYLGGPEVIPGFDQSEAVRTGTVDLIGTFHNWYMALFPPGAAFDVTPGSPMDERELGIYDYMVELHEDIMGVRYLGKLTWGQKMYWFVSKPIEKLEDVRGMQIAASGAHAEFAKLLGAVPVNLAWGEWYTSLERGVIEGVSTPIGTVRSLNLYDTLWGFVDHPFYNTGTYMLVNQDSWNRIPKKQQQIMLDVIKEMEVTTMQERLQDAENIKAKCLEAGLKPIKFSEADAKRFIDTADGVVWADVQEKVSPEVYNKLRELFIR